MERCQNCDYKWDKTTLWKLSYSKEGVNCSDCGQKQFISFDTQLFITLFSLSFIFGPSIFIRFNKN
ncbi:hypothetical protein CN692_18635 [Bacillus sp. AFS002410]|uniref:hypothetical protein n=1 Tax=Bacillus sp. AFS002410 TaxID=2033481 RepID=UPI000BF14D4E|nr:hypothetical protein [Bacillus sp. AFS002410]PEJ56190.1 hypothetical protein CN692_18635 [Bacillus sp. AFS002410]